MSFAETQERDGRATRPMFATRDGNELDAANGRHEFYGHQRRGIEGSWLPREPRHTFVSVMSDTGVTVEDIARLAGHTSSRITEILYRHQLRSVMEKGVRRRAHPRHGRPAFSRAR